MVTYFESNCVDMRSCVRKRIYWANCENLQNELSNPNIRPLGQGKIDSTKLPLLKKGETKDFSTEDFGGSVANPNKKDLPRHLGEF